VAWEEGACGTSWRGRVTCSYLPPRELDPFLCPCPWEMGSERGTRFGTLDPGTFWIGFWSPGPSLLFICILEFVFVFIASALSTRTGQTAIRKHWLQEPLMDLRAHLRGIGGEGEGGNWTPAARAWAISLIFSSSFSSSSVQTHSSFQSSSQASLAIFSPSRHRLPYDAATIGQGAEFVDEPLHIFVCSIELGLEAVSCQSACFASASASASICSIILWLDMAMAYRSRMMASLPALVMSGVNSRSKSSSSK
jgi:hypothetical protein